MKNNKITKTFTRLVILIILLLVIRTFAKQKTLFPLDLSFLGDMIAHLNDLTQEEPSESLITSELREALLSNPLGAGDSVTGDALAIDYVQVQGSDIGCTQVINPYARGDIPLDDSGGGDQSRIQSLHQGNFSIQLKEESSQMFVVSNSNKIAEVYCLKTAANNTQQAIILGQQDNLTYLILEFQNGQYTGKMERVDGSKELHS